MPTGVPTLQFPAVQTYDNATVVNWTDPPNADGTEPAHPAPSITLTAASTTESGTGVTAAASPADPPTDTTARWLGGAGLLVGALGLGLGGGALLRGRRASR